MELNVIINVQGSSQSIDTQNALYTQNAREKFGFFQIVFQEGVWGVQDVE